MNKVILITGVFDLMLLYLFEINIQNKNTGKLTYAGNLENLRDIEKSKNYFFEKGDIVDSSYVDSLFIKYVPYQKGLFSC